MSVTQNLKRQEVNLDFNLKPRQKRFVKEFVKTGNGYQSAIKAGYSDKTAKNSRANILTAETVKLAILKEVKDYQLMTQEETLQFVESKFLSLASSARKEDVQMNSAEKLAKLKGLMTDNININAVIEAKTASVVAILQEIGINPV